VSLYYFISIPLTHLNSPTKTSELLPDSDIARRIGYSISVFGGDSWVLPSAFIEELRVAGLYQ